MTEDTKVLLIKLGYIPCIALILIGFWLGGYIEQHNKGSVIPGAVLPIEEMRVCEIVELNIGRTDKVLLWDKGTHQRNWVWTSAFLEGNLNDGWKAPPNVKYVLDQEGEARRRIMYDMEIKKRFGIKEKN